MSGHRKIAKAAGIIIAVGFVSSIIGLAREIVIATQFGASAKTDAFVMSVNIPEAIMNLFAGGALVAAFLPVFSGLLAQKREQDAWRVAGGILNIIIILLGGLTVLGIIFTPQLVHLFAPGFVSEPETFKVTVMLTRITFPAMLFFGIATLFKGILHSFERFTVPAFTPLVLNLWIIFGATVLGGYFDQPVAGLAVGFLIGSLSQALIQLPLVLKQGKIIQKGLNLSDPDVRRVGKLIAPLVFGEVFGRLNVIVDRIIASFLFPGSIAALNFANKLVKMPVRTIGGSASSAMFPAMSKQLARGEEKEFWLTLEKAIRLIFFITIPIMVWCALFRLTIVKVVFQRGMFGEKDTLLTSVALLFFSFEITAGSLGHILNRAFFARHDTVTPIIANIISMLVKICLSVSLVWWWYQQNQTLALAGIALATAVSSWLKASILLGFLIRKGGGRHFTRLLPSILNTVLSSLIIFGAIFWLFSQTQIAGYFNVSYGHYLKFLFSLIFCGGLYLMGSVLMKRDEAGMLIGLIRKRKDVSQ